MMAKKKTGNYVICESKMYACLPSIPLVSRETAVGDTPERSEGELLPVVNAKKRE